MRYGYSLNEEGYHGDYESRDVAVAEALVEASDSGDYDPGSEVTVWTCEIKPYVVAPSAVGAWIAEWLRDNAEDECGEAVDMWPRLSSEQMVSLGERVMAIVLEMAPIKFWEAENVQAHHGNRIL
jgi:GNAT superfamily N-acetyltransferase